MPMKKGRCERLLEDEHVRRWHRNVARGSPITAEVALRRLSRLSELLKMSPKGMVESARNDLAKFQDMLEDMVAELEDEGRAPGYIEDLMKTIKSWLRYHDITLTRRIKIKNQTATPTIENERARAHIRVDPAVFAYLLRLLSVLTCHVCHHVF
jgi:hypothetical protein